MRATGGGTATKVTKRHRLRLEGVREGTTTASGEEEEEATGAAAGEEAIVEGTSEIAGAGRGADHRPDAVLQAGETTGRTGTGTADRQAQKVSTGLRSYARSGQRTTAATSDPVSVRSVRAMQEGPAQGTTAETGGTTATGEIPETAKQTTGAGGNTSVQTCTATATGIAETEATADLLRHLLGNPDRASVRRLSLARRSRKRYRIRGSLPLLQQAQIRAVRRMRTTMKQQWQPCSASADSAHRKWVTSGILA